MGVGALEFFNAVETAQRTNYIVPLASRRWGWQFGRRHAVIKRLAGPLSASFLLARLAFLAFWSSGGRVWKGS
ncbi:MAG: hypothetical protein DMG05_16125 [Acidobacteria bacterium]|nr:MAG: hypothetical protein DMG05_16125 [Acidobacteriota bacterium]